MKQFPALLSPFLLAALLACIFLPASLAQKPAEQNPAEQTSIIPPGKAERGLTLFLEKGCFQCHGAGSTKLPEVDIAPHLVIELGDDVHRPWTRDEFAKAILNPNHTVAEEYRIAMMRVGDNFKAENSPMPEYVDILTVSDLIHLATFLESLSEQALPITTPARP